MGVRGWGCESEGVWDMRVREVGDVRTYVV